MSEEFTTARRLIHEFKGDRYAFGFESLRGAGPITAKLGGQTAFVCDNFEGSEPFVEQIRDSLQAAGLKLLGEIDGARPNAPREDLVRITGQLVELNPDVIVGFGGGSTLDAVKAAEVLRTLGGTIEDYFGTGLVTETLSKSGRALKPNVAIQTAASSAAHLTKYSNITDVRTGQKKLIVDDAIVPPYALFDFGVTLQAPPSLTLDGALDGLSHCLEVLYSSVGKSSYLRVEEIAREAIGLVVEYLPRVLENPADRGGREGLALATDLGGYAIMLGGTNGAHLTSFSLVDVLSHGRACAMLNPYYSVLFAPAIEDPLRMVGEILRKQHYIDADLNSLGGRDLGLAVGQGFLDFYEAMGVPTKLEEIPGFGDQHIERALLAAKQPQLRMKLENMPIPLTAAMVDQFMGPVLEAAKTGDLQRVKSAH